MAGLSLLKKIKGRQTTVCQFLLGVVVGAIAEKVFNFGISAMDALEALDWLLRETRCWKRWIIKDAGIDGPL